MTVVLNGDEAEFADGTTVLELVEQVYGVLRGVAVAIGGVVVPRSTWAEQQLASGDRIEVLTAVQGG